LNYAPVVLFVYNRPDHTRRTVEALKINILASQSDLYIFSDAPKKIEAAEAVLEVREYLKSISGFRSVHIFERDKNWGLANSIIDGVTRLCNQYGRVIVLEDDLITSLFFLNYMNDALNVYQDEEKVMHVSGYMFPIDNHDSKDTFFLRTATCWGWATWDRAWRQFTKEPKKLLGEYTEQKINDFNMDGAYNFWAQVEQNAAGSINTWAIFWYATVFEVSGLCLHPAVSMVSNIGHDDTGEHCSKGSDFNVVLASEPVRYFERDIKEGEDAYLRTKEFFLAMKPKYFRRILSLIKQAGMRLLKLV
jgi:hypothetical protein